MRFVQKGLAMVAISVTTWLALDTIKEKRQKNRLRTIIKDSLPS